MSACWAGCCDESLKLQSCDYVIVFSIAIPSVIVGQIKVTTSRYYDCSNFQFHFFWLLVKVDGFTCSTSIHAFEAFNTVVSVYCIYEGNGLVKRNGDGFSCS